MLPLLLLLLTLLIWVSPTSTSTILVPYAESPSAVTISQVFSPNSPLKVLCAGDSITVGIGDGNTQGSNNGYRLDLYDLLAADNITTEFIGTQISGTSDNLQPRMEGYGWQTIETILSRIQDNNILRQQPNLVLIHAGTNDNDLPQTSNDPATLFADAPVRLGQLLDYILFQDPKAIVLVAKLIQNKYNQTQTNAFNAQVPGVVSERYDRGFKVQMVDMTMVGGDELSDALHPTAMGYYHVANLWYDAIMGVPHDWWAISSNPSQLPSFPTASITQPASPTRSISASPLQAGAPNQNASSQTLLAAPQATATSIHPSSALQMKAVSSLCACAWITIFWIIFHD